MERDGVISRWDDEKGFGFIRPPAGGGEFFLHISAFRGDRRPLEGDAVRFVAGTDRQGRPRAEHARLAGLAIDLPPIRQKPPAPATRAKARSGREFVEARRPRPMPAALALLAALLLLPLAGAWSWLHDGHPGGWLLAYPGFSLIAFFAYWRDKRSAERGAWRTPEQSLHLFELLGGWPGAFLAQRLFRHKTRKLSFLLPFWGIVLLHQAFWLDHLGGGFLFAALARQLGG